MKLHCICGEELQVDENPTDDETREARLAEAEAWSKEHKGEGHDLGFDVSGIGSGGSTGISPRED